MLCGCRQHEAVTSAILVGSQVIRHAAAAAQGQLWGPFVAAAWPWTMWHHHAIRSPPFTPHSVGSPVKAVHILISLLLVSVLSNSGLCPQLLLSYSFMQVDLLLTHVRQLE